MFISGAGINNEGTIYNSVAFNPASTFNITLLGDATIGCQSGAIWNFNVGSGAVISGPHKLTINWGATSDYTEWNGIVFATNSGDFELAHGKLGIKNMGSNFGNPTNTFTVDAGTELDFWTADFGYAKNYHVFGLYQLLAAFTTFNGNITLETGSQLTGVFGGGNQTMNGNVVLNGVSHFVLGDANFVFANAISGPGGFVWDAYNHEMILQAANTYTGPTVIGGGQQVLALSGNGSISQSSLIFFGGGQNNSANTSIDATGRADQTLTLANGQTLAGIGGINGSLVVSPGATISPAGTNTVIGITTGANATGTLAVSANATLGGTTIIKLNGSGTNDVVQAEANIMYGGNLNLANISGAPMVAGDTFQIFNAANYSGSFGSITPATPGAGLAWDKTQLGSGMISVVAGGSSPVVSTIRLSGGNLIFSGTGGTANAGYSVLTTTNLTTSLTNWSVLSTGKFDGSGAFSVTNAIGSGSGQGFFTIRTP
jgi:hypothetical protein